MAYQDRQTQRRGPSGWSRTRWLVIAGILVAAVVVVVLVFAGGGGMGGGSGGGGGGWG